MLTGACGLAAAGRLRRGGRSLAATFVFGESAPLEGAAPAGGVAPVGEHALPRARREVLVGLLVPARAREGAGDHACGGVQ